MCIISYYNLQSTHDDLYYLQPGLINETPSIIMLNIHTIHNSFVIVGESFKIHCSWDYFLKLKNCGWNDTQYDWLTLVDFFLKKLCCDWLTFYFLMCVVRELVVWTTNIRKFDHMLTILLRTCTYPTLLFPSGPCDHIFGPCDHLGRTMWSSLTISQGGTHVCMHIQLMIEYWIKHID